MSGGGVWQQVVRLEASAFGLYDESLSCAPDGDNMTPGMGIDRGEKPDR